MSKITFADIQRLPDFSVRQSLTDLVGALPNAAVPAVEYDANVRDDNCYFDMQWSDDPSGESFGNTMNLRTQAVTASSAEDGLPPKALIARLVETVDLYVTQYVADLWCCPVPRRRSIKFTAYRETGEVKGGWAASYEVVAACPATFDWGVGVWEISLRRAVS